MITLSESQWLKIYNQLAQEHPQSWLIIRDSMKRNLGFTVRRHNRWISHEYEPNNILSGRSGYFRNEICLDFYDDIKETFFRLKYL